MARLTSIHKRSLGQHARAGTESLQEIMEDVCTFFLDLRVAKSDKGDNLKQSCWVVLPLAKEWM